MSTERAYSFGSRLRRLRRAAGLSQEQLAERAGLTAAAVGALERGDRRHPYPHTLQALADALGLAGPEREAFFLAVRQRGAPDGPGEPPMPPDSHPPAGAFPHPLTPLVGREHDVQILETLLRDEHTRLVTLSGPGGAGKTRLALAVAASAAERFEAGAVWVDLAPVSDPALLLPSIARALRLTVLPGDAAREALHAYLSRRRVLLVLDNLEQLLEGVDAVADLLASCPGVVVLATSREALRLVGEHELHVGPLPVSRGPARGDAAVHERPPAFRLFAERASAVSSGFDAEADAAVVTAICERLDGLPLAIELAAAQLRYMPPRVLLVRLRAALDTLAVQWRDRPGRQRSVRASLDWSHELLSDGERRAFRRLAVFAGSFTAEAAAALFATDDGPRESARDGLAGLVDKSLVELVGAFRDEARYRMLAPIREYAGELLAETGEEPEVRRRHADHYGRLVTTLGAQIPGPGAESALQQLDADIDNLRAAFDWYVGAGDPCAAMRLAGALAWFWLRRGSPEEGQRKLRAALAAASTCPPTVGGVAWYASAALAWKQERYAEALADADRAISELRRADAARELALALAIRGLTTVSRGEPEAAIPFHEESLALFRAAGNGWGEAYAAANLADALLELDRTDRAEQLYGESLAGFDALGDRWGRGIVVHQLANLALRRAQYPRAHEHYREAARIWRSQDNAVELARSLVGLGAAALHRGDTEAANASLLEACGTWRDLGSRAGVAAALAGIAAVSAREHRFREAASLMGHPEATVGEAAPPYGLRDGLFAPWLAEVRDALGEAAYQLARSEGAGRRLEDLLAGRQRGDGQRRGPPEPPGTIAGEATRR